MIRAATLGVTLGIAAGVASFVPAVRGLTPWQRQWVLGKWAR